MRRNALGFGATGAAAVVAGAVYVGMDQPRDGEIRVDWRAVAYNAPSRSMPNPTPWVHGLIRGSAESCPRWRIQLAPQAGGGVIDLLFVAPDQKAAEAMDWDRGTEVAVNGHAVTVQKSVSVAADWNCKGDENGLIWQLQAQFAPDHPLVVEAAQAAQGPQDAAEAAEREFDAYAREWMDRNFPHPDFMNTVRELELEWTSRPEWWPGDPMPDAEGLLNKARGRLTR